jgi:hypothetical protein
MAKRLTGRNPLAYMGVEPVQPPNMVQSPVSPTDLDVQNFNLGDFWINTTTETLYVLVSQQRGIATWITTFGGAASTFVTDSGTATDSGGIINIIGDGLNTNTSASGNTINVNLNNSLTLSHLALTGIGIEGVVQTDASGNLFANNGSNGQILIGGGTAPAWANITAGSNISIVNGANSITISASGAGGGGAVNFITDTSGPATELGGNITFAGGHNITTDGSVAHTVTLNLTGTTNHAVQVGNATSSLSSLAVGTNGQVLIGSTGANPTFASLTSSDGSITFTPGPGTLSLQAVGGGGAGGVITTTYNTPGTYTWTKNVDTSYVEIWAWCGGGGGGSGSSQALNNTGGGGGGSGSFFRFKGPASFFGATETVVVGAGGTGGASVSSGVGNNGATGTASSFGNIQVPVCVNNAVANATLSSLQQYGLGGGGPGFIAGYSGGIFTDDAGLIYNAGNSNFQYSVPVAGITATPTLHGGGAGSFAIGANGLSVGGLAPYGLPFRGSFGFMFMLPTSGGQGGSISSSPINYFNGGTGGSVLGFNTTTVISAGGTAGVAGGATTGGNGNVMPSSGGLVFGGTGGGGGAADPNLGGNGGNGGFPGGGGGGGGAASAGKPSGAGGNGAGGLVIVIEWT